MNDNPIIRRRLAEIERLGRKELTVGEVQAILGYATEYPITSDRGIVARCQVTAAKIGGRWLIDAESLKSYITNSISILQF